VDRYDSFTQLQYEEEENTDYRIRWRPGSSGVLIMSIHGGNIEPGTTQIADALAGQDHSFYSFEGIKPRDNLSLHITSTRFDEPRALELVCLSEIIISIHGCKNPEPLIYVGGLDREIIQRIRIELEKMGINTAECSESSFSGEAEANICNLCGRGMGVQLELSSGLRHLLFRDLSEPEKGRYYPTELLERFIDAIQRAIRPYVEIYRETTPLPGTNGW
jgi:phage replication-related protein YjqB (UPF0714/DUF867 family)